MDLYSLSVTSLCVMLYRAEKPSLATAMSVWKDRDRIPVDDWISGGILVPQYRPIRGPTAGGKTQKQISNNRNTSDTALCGLNVNLYS